MLKSKKMGILMLSIIMSLPYAYYNFIGYEVVSIKRYDNPEVISSNERYFYFKGGDGDLIKSFPNINRIIVAHGIFRPFGGGNCINALEVVRKPYFMVKEDYRYDDYKKDFNSKGLINDTCKRVVVIK